ncbi:MAG: cell division protein ZapA [Cryomorphaceae bacterium]|nr:MAG: cell division protein ZapA [Cryomorphaceae bacterium]
MSELSIRVSIAGRVYPLTVEQQEEEIVRKAAKYIDQKINELKNQYAVNDIQDYLAMVALEMSAKLQEPPPTTDVEMDEQVEVLRKKLESCMK